MKLNYFPYCLADRLFYDDPQQWTATRERYRQADDPPHENWVTREDGTWFHCVPQGARLPAQGWKVHVSANRETAQKVLDITSAYCVAHGIAFKFLLSESALISRNLKYADRSGSGKFITVYPTDDDVLRATLDDLSESLRGLGGPYILSDLRWGDGPLYIRYGAFAMRYVRDEYGVPVPAMADPEGRLVPDRREPVFRHPEWVTPPEFLRPHLERRRAAETPADFPYRIRSALHFSNGGGIYLAEELRTGATVVLKEARPHAGLEHTGRDAVTRLLHERDILTRLSGVEGVVGLRGHLEAWEHHFLVEEYVEGATLSAETVARHPLVHPEPDPAAVAEFTRWALDTTDAVARVLDRLHARGVAFGDLHPNNVLVRPDGRVALVDFEIAADADDTTRSGMGAPGFVPPDRRGPLAADRYALACLRVSVFLPLTVLFTLDTGTARTLVDAVRDVFPVPDGWAESVLADLALDGSPWAGTDAEMARSAALIAGGTRRTPDWPAIEASIARAIALSATPERTDRLFPGDVDQFRISALGLAHGAAGVVHALSAAGHGVEDGWIDWLLHRVRTQASPHRLGFYDGLHGIAHALEQAGRRDDALEVLDRAAGDDDTALGDDLFAGLSGIALNRLHFADLLGDSGLRDAALRTAERLHARPRPAAGAAGRPRTGLLHGRSGVALLAVRLYEATGDPAHLDTARRELTDDLGRCAHRADDDTLHVDDGRRTLPYVADGSAGIGLVLREYLRHRDDDAFAAALARIRRAAEPAFGVFPMLFQGTAGLMGTLAHLRDPAAPDDRLEDAIAHTRDRLRWYMVGVRGEVALPGDQLMRVSMDLATGGAGVLLALAAARGGGPPLLPFLTPPPPPPSGG
ncbi:class III lanthionine synthetase LanKC [Nocardiopsis trehalosi]|jgi:serine/threonine protein kinase|uniref:class III lanthionine synthetase LanKC n=1 Tax=Nocardiopsis trehalosi TaxID=109329 RepID=UPI0009FC5DCA|nr:class III lanthionine synthetase LanKC [Nocardiopsis trehalosi]